MSTIKENTRRALWDFYIRNGIGSVEKKAKELIYQSEHSQLDFRKRIEFKGELAEIVLECYLHHFSQLITPSMFVKSLCIKNKFTGLTTEMDVTFFTPCRVYMFECKSYSGRKTLTNECTLSNKSTTTDVFGQSKHHMEILNQYISRFRVNSSVKGASPYKLILFELSSEDCDDRRDDHWRSVIPVVTLSQLYDWMEKEFSKPMKVNWDVRKMYRTIEILDQGSEELFKEHLKRLKGARK